MVVPWLALMWGQDRSIVTHSIYINLIRVNFYVVRILLEVPILVSNQDMMECC